VCIFEMHGKKHIFHWNVKAYVKKPKVRVGSRGVSWNQNLQTQSRTRVEKPHCQFHNLLSYTRHKVKLVWSLISMENWISLIFFSFVKPWLQANFQVHTLFGWNSTCWELWEPIEKLKKLNGNTMKPFRNLVRTLWSKS
jgi:hypothetical protein